MAKHKKRDCSIKILDEVNCVFTGLHPDHIGLFYEQYGMFAPNYYFNPKYKLGAWDGKIRYFHKTGKTYVNLLEEIIPQVVSLGYQISITDNRKSVNVDVETIDKTFFSHVINDEGQPWEMRSYQVDMVNKLIENGGGIGIAGTGGGKTSMCAALALAYEKANDFKSIIIVPDKNLTDQTRREYQFFGVDVGQYSGEVKDLDHKHIVSTWQSLKNNPTIIHSFDVIIVDECHGLKGNVLSKLLNEHGKNIPYRFGVTGTLPKEKTDALAVRVALGDVVYTIPAHELIEKGYLANLHIDIFQLQVDLKKQYQEYLEEGNEKITYTQFKDAYFPEWTAEKNFLQSEPTRLQWIADYIQVKRDLGKGNVFCLVNGVKFGKKLASMIEGAIFVHGQDKMSARNEVYDLFKENDNIVVIATIHIASTGLDIKRIFNLIYIDVGKSFIRTIQSIGRGLRKAHDKDSVHVTDICSDLKYSKRHLRERINYYKEAKYKHKKKVIEI